MNNQSARVAAMAKLALELMPPMIRASILGDQALRRQYGLQLDAVVSFGEAGCSMRRSALFSAIRKLFSADGEVEVRDGKGRAWVLQGRLEDDEKPIITLSHGDRQYALPDFYVLSPNRSERCRWFAYDAEQNDLPAADRERWMQILKSRPLDDEEVDPFNSDIQDTPTHVAGCVRDGVCSGESQISSLAPQSKRYYERLIGRWNNSMSVRDYASNVIRNVFVRNIDWRPYEGLLNCLLLASHSAISDEINLRALSEDVVLRAFQFLESDGDVVSQLGAIEVGLRFVSDLPQLEASIVKMIKKIRDDDVTSESSEIRIFSALFVLVDGELARLSLFDSEPPYYRRLASLTQAALVHRQLTRRGISYKEFVEGAFAARGEWFYIQTLADMRLEPRWHAELADPGQMKADFLGRIVNGARTHEPTPKLEMLRDLLMGDDLESVRNLAKFPHSFLPGPLEGHIDGSSPMPEELSRIVQSQLKAENLEARSFFAIVNSALTFSVDSNYAELATQALELANHRLPKINNGSQLVAVLQGLAYVAAVSRSDTLADALRLMVRRYRRDLQFKLSIEDAMRICLIACACREDAEDWKSAVGDWITELAFEDLGRDEAELLFSHLQCLKVCVQDLWVYCGRADAALQALVDA